MTEEKALSPQDLELVRQFERGRRLQALKSDPVWREIEDILDEIVDSAEDELLGYGGINKDEIAALHQRAHDFRTMADAFRHAVEASISDAHDIPAFLLNGEIGTPGF